jgi:hypothetical protein
VRKQKIIGTTEFVNKEIADAMSSIGLSLSHGQIRIICKCTSKADANKKCLETGLFINDVFKTGWYSRTGNEQEFKVCESTDIAIRPLDDTSDRYVSIEELKKIIGKGGGGMNKNGTCDSLGYKTAKLSSDYDPDTFLMLTRTMDGDIVLSIYGKGEFRIATSGGNLHGNKLIEITGLFSKIIDAIND